MNKKSSQTSSIPALREVLWASAPSPCLHVECAMTNCMTEKTPSENMSWGHLTNDGGIRRKAWWWGTAKCFVFPSQLPQVEFLKETVYLSVHNDINPPLPSDPSEYHWVRRENGQMTGLSKVTPCDNSIGLLGFVPQFLGKNTYPLKEKKMFSQKTPT